VRGGASLAQPPTTDNAFSARPPLSRSALTIPRHNPMTSLLADGVSGSGGIPGASLPFGFPASEIPGGVPGSGPDSWGDKKGGCACGCDCNGGGVGGDFPDIPFRDFPGLTGTSPVPPRVRGKNTHPSEWRVPGPGGLSRGRTSVPKGGGTPAPPADDDDELERGWSVAPPMEEPKDDGGGGCYCPTIPICPEEEPKPGNGDWCLDCYNVGDPTSHCGLPCYRSYGTGTIGGQQCCYSEGKLVTRSHPELAECMGTIDLVATAEGEVPRTRTERDPQNDRMRMRGVTNTRTTIQVENDDYGCCDWSETSVIGHLGADVYDSKKCPGYDAMQDCMRRGEGGSPPIPSGDASGGRGVTDDELIEAYYRCKEKYCNEIPGTAGK